jgi:hypothetical protein
MEAPLDAQDGVTRDGDTIRLDLRPVRHPHAAAARR